MFGDERDKKNREPGASGAEIKEQLEQIESTVAGALNAVGVVMGAALKESAKAHRYARLATEYAIEKAYNPALSDEGKEVMMRTLDADAEQYGQRLWRETAIGQEP